MGKPYNIAISIAEPCNEDWGQMAPNKEGRACKQCSKNVIDFTGWGDAQLYDFFSRPQGHICGRFFSTQLEREIALPVQRHSRLYRIAVALSLTLVFTAGEGKTFARQPVIFESPASRFPEYGGETTGDTATITGIVINKANKPIPNTVVKLTKGNIVVGSAKSNKEGQYSFHDIGAGPYGLTFIAPGYQKKSLTGISAPSGNTTVLKKVATITAHLITATSGVVSVQAKPGPAASKGKK